MMKWHYYKDYSFSSKVTVQSLVSGTFSELVIASMPQPKIENKQRLTGIKVKLYFECTPCSNVNGCDDDEELTIDFLEQSRTTTIQVDRDMENWSQFFPCRHTHDITYN